MDPFSLASGIAGLASLAAAVVSAAYSYGSSLAGASQAVKGLIAELQDLRTTLQQLEIAVQKVDPHSTEHYPQASTKLLFSVEECRTTLEKLQEKLRKRENAGRVKKALYRVTWPLTKSDMLSAVQSLARSRGSFHLALTLDTWDIASLTLSAVETNGKKQGEFHQDARSQKILEWLSSFNHRTKHETIIGLKAPNTGNWLLTSPEFLQFEKGTRSLWCHGLPGVGKTVMSAIVIDYISNTKPPDTAIIYHYFDYVSAAQHPPETICRIFLRQLVQQHQALPVEVEQLFIRADKLNIIPDLRLLTDTLLAVLNSFKAALIVIDALDECSEQYQHAVRELLNDLQKSSRCSFFVTARSHIEPLEEESSQCSHIEITAHEEDIRRLFDRTLERNGRFARKLTTEFKDEIVLAIIDKAQGMFLWASLQIAQLLENRTQTMIRRALQEMPRHINDVFDKTLVRVGNNDLARRTLLWLACAKEPLTFPALSHALSMDPEYYDSSGVDQDNIPDAEDLVDICCGLVMADIDGNIRFVHFAVQEYFQTRPGKFLPWNEVLIAQTCLKYLSFQEFQAGYCDSEEKIRRRLREYPLCLYAARRWAEHLPKEGETSVQDLIIGIYSHDNAFSSYSQLYYSQPASRNESGLHARKRNDISPYFDFLQGFTPLHNAASLGLMQISKMLLERGSDPSPKTMKKVTPLHLAVEAGNPKLVTLFLSKGADRLASANFDIHIFENIIATEDSCLETGQYHQADFDFKNWVRSYSQIDLNALELAAVLGFLEIFNLLASGVDAEAAAKVLDILHFRSHPRQEFASRLLQDHLPTDHKHPVLAAALEYAVFHGAMSVFRVSLDSVPDLDDRDKLLTRLLGLSVSVCDGPPQLHHYRHHFSNYLGPKNSLPKRNAHFRDVMAKEMIEKGASISPYLYTTICNGRRELAGLMVDRGAGLNRSPYLDRKSPHPSDGVLEATIRRGWEDLAMQMIENGADVSHPRILEAAVQANMEKVANHLLDRGTNIEGERSDSELFPSVSPLRTAVRLGNTQMVDLLLRRGADPNGQGVGPTPLDQAAYRGHTAIGKSLLERGANVNGDSSCTSLNHACIGGHQEFVELLLDYGASINEAEKSSGYTALMRAVQQGNAGLCKFLLERGAQVNWLTDYGSPLTIASSCNRNDVVAILLEKGADPNLRYGTAMEYALEKAAMIGNEDLVRMLLDSGADLHARGGKHGSPLHAAVKSHNQDMTRYILDLGAEVFEHPDFEGLLCNANPRDYQLLMDRGADVNKRGGKYGNPLQAAITRACRDGWHRCYWDENAEETVKFLLDHGADANAIGGVYQTPLQAAARVGNTSIVDLLLSCNADATIVGGRYGSALHAAAFRGNEDVVQLLLDAGSDVNHRSGKYYTALQAAAFRGHEAVVKLLLRYGAEVNAEGGIYHNALRAARVEIPQLYKVVDRLLIDAGAVDDASKSSESEDEIYFDGQLDNAAGKRQERRERKWRERRGAKVFPDLSEDECNYMED